MNMQFAIEDGKVYVIEANPRASRTVPLVSKVGGVQMAGIATKLMLGETVKSLGLDKRHVVPYFGVKEAVLPFEKFPDRKSTLCLGLRCALPARCSVLRMALGSRTSSLRKRRGLRSRRRLARCSSRFPRSTPTRSLR